MLKKLRTPSPLYFNMDMVMIILLYFECYALLFMQAGCDGI